MRFERPVRLPLQIGTTALWALCRGAFTLVPGIALLLASLIGLAGAALFSIVLPGLGWIVLGVVLVEAAAIRWAYRSLALAWRSRPSDVVLGPDGLEIEGGPRDGEKVRWTELREGETTIVKDKGTLRLFVGKVHAKGEKTKRRLVAEAEDPVEKVSLRALATTLESFDRASVATPPRVPGDVELLVCASCGAPTTPADVDETPCRACGAAVEMPKPLRARIAALRDVESARSRSKTVARRLLDQPGARFSNLLYALVAAPTLIAWTAAFVMMGVLHHRRTLAFLNVALLGTAVCAAMAGLFFLLRARLANRVALRFLTVDLAAVAPSEEGEPSSCRVCLAPLAERPGEMIATCVYCRADNVLGVDLRSERDPSAAQAASLDATLAARSRELGTWRLRAAGAFALLPFAGWAVSRGVHPLGPETVAVDQCNHDVYSACVEAAAFQTRAPDGDAKAASVYLQKACDATHREGCVELGELLTIGGKNLPFDPRRAHEIFAKACDASVARACTADGRCYESGRGVDASLEKAAALYERGCTSSDGEGCRRLGEYVRDGVVTRDLERARSLFRRACSLKDADGCALDAEGSLGTDEPAARKQMTEACTAGSARACSFVAEWLVQSHPAPAELERALTLLRKGCNSAQEGRSCYVLARMHDEGIAKDTEYASALRFATAGCSYGEGDACLLAGRAEQKSGDVARAARLLNRACVLHVGEGCARQADLVMAGRDGPEDEGRAEELRRRACDDGYAPACPRPAPP